MVAHDSDDDEKCAERQGYVTGPSQIAITLHVDQRHAPDQQIEAGSYVAEQGAFVGQPGTYQGQMIPQDQIHVVIEVLVRTQQ